MNPEEAVQALNQLADLDPAPTVTRKLRACTEEEFKAIARAMVARFINDGAVDTGTWVKTFQAFLQSSALAPMAVVALELAFDTVFADLIRGELEKRWGRAELIIAGGRTTVIAYVPVTRLMDEQDRVRNLGAFLQGMAKQMASTVATMVGPAYPGGAPADSAQQADSGQIFVGRTNAMLPGTTPGPPPGGLVSEPEYRALQEKRRQEQKEEILARLGRGVAVGLDNVKATTTKPIGEAVRRGYFADELSEPAEVALAGEGD